MLFTPKSLFNRLFTVGDILAILTVAISASLFGSATLYLSPPNKTTEFIFPEATLSDVQSVVASKDGSTRETTLVDARSAFNYEQGHIPSAINLPVGDYYRLFHQLASRLHGRVIVYCSGFQCSDSKSLALLLKKSGVTDILVYTNGWEEWQALTETDAPQ